MKVKDVIKDLQKYNQDENIVAFWYSRTDFTEENNPISIEVWDKAVENYYEIEIGEDDDMVRNSIYDSLWECNWVQADLAVEIMFEEVDAVLNYQPEETE